MRRWSPRHSRTAFRRRGFDGTRWAGFRAWTFGSRWFCVLATTRFLVSRQRIGQQRCDEQRAEETACDGMGHRDSPVGVWYTTEQDQCQWGRTQHTYVCLVTLAVYVTKSQQTSVPAHVGCQDRRQFDCAATWFRLQSWERPPGTLHAVRSREGSHHNALFVDKSVRS